MAIYYRILKDGIEVNTYSRNGFYREFRFAILDQGKEVLEGVSLFASMATRKLWLISKKKSIELVNRKIENKRSLSQPTNKS